MVLLSVPEEVIGILLVWARVLNWSMSQEMPLSAATWARMDRSLPAETSIVLVEKSVIEAASAPKSVTYMRAMSMEEPRRAAPRVRALASDALREIVLIMMFAPVASSWGVGFRAPP